MGGLRPPRGALEDEAGWKAALHTGDRARGRGVGTLTTAVIGRGADCAQYLSESLASLAQWTGGRRGVRVEASAATPPPVFDRSHVRVLNATVGPHRVASEIVAVLSTASLAHSTADSGPEMRFLASAENAVVIVPAGDLISEDRDARIAGARDLALSVGALNIAMRGGRLSDVRFVLEGTEGGNLGQLIRLDDMFSAAGEGCGARVTVTGWLSDGPRMGIAYALARAVANERFSRWALDIPGRMASKHASREVGEWMLREARDPRWTEAGR